MLKKVTIANLNVEGRLKKDELVQVGGSICDMPMPDNSCLRYCKNHCGTVGNDKAHESGQDYYRE